MKADKINADNLCTSMVYEGQVFKQYDFEPCALIYGTTIEEVKQLYDKYKKTHDKINLLSVYTPCDWWNNRELIQTFI